MGCTKQSYIVSENGKAATLYGGAGQGTHNGAVMQSIGLDLYNGNTTGDIAATLQHVRENLLHKVAHQ